MAMREIDPSETNRLLSYQYYINAPQPMVTLFTTLNITKLVRYSKKGYRLNMLLCYVIGSAAQQTPEFKLLPVGKKLYRYDDIGINVIVANSQGGINSCDICYNCDLEVFRRDYEPLTKKVYSECTDYETSERMIIGTSSLAKYAIDGAVNMYSGIFNNPFLIWGKYEKKGFKKLLKLSFQFHHVQMDGAEACEFLQNIQKQIDHLVL